MTRLEKQHGQDEWKIQQGDDLLEMVEKERDEMEEKYKAVISKLQYQLKNQSQMKSELTSADDNVIASSIQKDGHVDAKLANQSVVQQSIVGNTSKPARPPPGFEHVNPASMTTASTAMTTTSCDQSQLKLLKRKSSVQKGPIESLKLHEMPTVLKSLGWSNKCVLRKQ